NQNKGVLQEVGEKHDHGIDGDLSQAKSECTSPDVIDKDISQPTTSVLDAGKRKTANPVQPDVAEAKSEAVSPDTVDKDIQQPTVSVEEAGKKAAVDAAPFEHGGVETCIYCASPMSTSMDSPGVSHHLTDWQEIDYDADADHV